MTENWPWKVFYSLLRHLFQTIAQSSVGELFFKFPSTDSESWNCGLYNNNALKRSGCSRSLLDPNECWSSHLSDCCFVNDSLQLDVFLRAQFQKCLQEIKRFYGAFMWLELGFNRQLNVTTGSFLGRCAEGRYTTDPLRSALLAAPARLNSCSLLRKISDSTSSGWRFHSTHTENMELQLQETDV